MRRVPALIPCLAVAALLAGCAAAPTDGPSVETGQVVGEAGDPLEFLAMLAGARRHLPLPAGVVPSCVKVLYSRSMRSGVEAPPRITTRYLKVTDLPGSSA